MRKSLYTCGPVVFTLVFAAAPLTPAAAQLLVEPIDALGQRGFSVHHPPLPPSVDFDERMRTDPGESGNSGSLSLWSEELGTDVAGDSRYHIDYFFQHPNIMANVLAASGHARARALVGTATDLELAASATTRARLAFRVTEPVAWDLTGMIAITEALAIGDGTGEAVVRLDLHRTEDPFDAHTWLLDEFTISSLPVAASGILEPGDWVLSVSALAGAESSTTDAHWLAQARYDVRLELSPIPAPGAGMTLGLAAVGAVGGTALPRRRRG